MIIRDLTGKKHNINLGAMSTNNGHILRSSLHLEARRLLKEIYPTAQIIEEVSIPIYPGQTVFFDFFLPLISLFVEVQGQQHYEKSGLFHKNDTDFLMQKKRDGNKVEWAELNGFTLVCLPYNKISEWEILLRS